jgi:gliding motility-associated-like protein
MKRTIILFSSFLILSILQSQNRFSFIENKGQWDGDFLFKTDIPGGVMFLENHGITYHLVDWSEWHNSHGKDFTLGQSPLLKGHAVKINFVNGQAPSQVMTASPQSYYHNYYRGNDSKKWVSKIHPMGNVLLKNMWNGVDLQYYNAGGQLKYDFIVNPQADYGQIRLNYTGAESLELRNGALVVKTTVGEIIEEKPYAYQLINGEKIEVSCEFVLAGSTLSFQLGALSNPNIAIVIDPSLIFASYSGSTSDNFGMTATYGAGGFLYAGGTAFGPGYPTSVGAYQTTATAGLGIGGITDVVISKYSPDGDSLIYSTYLGGGSTNDGTETVHSMIEDSQGNLCVYGVTSSTNFPTTPGAYDVSHGGGGFITFPQNGSTFNTGTDIYVTKFNTNGTALIGSTYIGGSANDGVNSNITTTLYDSLMFNYGDQFRGEIYVDSLDNVYVTSCTQSADFPTVNAYQSSFAGRQDAVVFKLNPALANLIFSTYVGGTGADAGYGLKLDDKLNVYFTGGTSSADFPTTPGAYDPVYNGGKADAYIASLSADGDSLYNSTFIGTTGYDQSFFIEIDPYNTLYIYGQTANPAGFPVINAAYANANSGQFILNIDSALSNVIYASKFGNDNGTINISPTALRVDVCGNIYISGWGANILQPTPLNGMPVTADAFQSSNGDGFNFYLAVFKTYFDGLHFGSYFGGGVSHEHVDGGTSRFSDDGYIYQSVCAGCGSNNDFPTTPGAWSNTNNSNNCNNGVFKMQFPLPEVVAQITAPPAICKGRTINFTSLTTGANYIHWEFGDGGTSSIQNPSHLYNAAGTYIVQLVVIDTSFITCVSFDTAYATIVVVDGDTTYTLPDVVICSGVQEQIGITPDPAHTYIWTPVTALTSSTIADPFAYPSSNTLYTLLDSDSICTDTIYQNVLVDLPPNADFDYTSYIACAGVSLALHDHSTNADSTHFTINGVYFPGDSIKLDWSSSYVITLWAYNGECVDSTSLVFNSGNFGDLFQLTMPNVFTPFTSGGENDRFCPIGLNGEYCYTMYVYNRWGTEIWQSELQEPCWDGLHRDTDNPAVDGIYYYVIKFQGGDQASFFHLLNEH